MGKKGRKQKKTREFQNNPFRDLKGLSVSAPDKSASAQPAAQDAKRPATPAGNSGDLFAREMDFLGVQRVSGDEQSARDKETGQAESPPPPQSADPPAETDEFLAALGRLDVTFTDEFPENDAPGLPKAAPRRMRQLRQGRLVPEDELDLHGMHRDRALEKVGWFLEDCVFQGLRTVLIITGRGQHSPEGPVLRETVARYLRGEGADLVLEWGTAPPRYGGEGALVVFLRQRTEGEKA